MKTANKTDIGHTRLVNEDRTFIEEQLNGFTLAIVADGMGGHQAGDIASQMAIETIQGELQALHQELTNEQCETLIRRAIIRANEVIFKLASEKLEYQGMGTTVVLAVADEQSVIVAHIGDSRAYRMSDDTIVQLTEDHSLVVELIKSGQISAEEADHHPRRNVLTRALGTDPEAEMDLRRFEWQPDDIILLCSDGLSSLVDEQQIRHILKQDQSLDWKVNELVSCALEAGGGDNISVALLANVNEDRNEMRCDE